MPRKDVIVLGVGGVGSAALFHLAARGLRVLGIDRFAPGHDRGSSHGESRIIRQAYFEHADYVPLLYRAYELWRELERLTQTPLFFPVGLLEIGPPDGVVIPGVLESARKFHLEVEELTPEAVARRFPGYRMPPGMQAVFEPQAGYLLVEECVRAHVQRARQLGAELHIGETIISWQVQGDGVKVVTDRDVYQAGKLIITAGAWASELVRELGVPLRVLRKHVYWYGSSGALFRREARAPTFLYELPQGVFYGFPEISPGEIKVGEHTGGSLVDDALTDDRAEDAIDRRRVDAFVADCLASATTQALRHSTCYYTMSPDENFLIDIHPRYSQVAFAAGLSGHGFKFTPVLGEALADLVTTGKTQLPIEFLSTKRFA